MPSLTVTTLTQGPCLVSPVVKQPALNTSQWDGDCSHEIKWRLLLGREAVTNLDSRIEKQAHHFANKGPYGQNYGFSSSHVWI